MDKDGVSDTTGNGKKLKSPVAVDLSLWVGGVKESPVWHIASQEEKGYEGRSSKKQRTSGSNKLEQGPIFIDMSEPRDSDLLTFTQLGVKNLGKFQKRINDKYLSGTSPSKTTQFSIDDDKENRPPSPPITRSRSKRGNRKPQPPVKVEILHPIIKHKVLQRLFLDYSKGMPLTGLSDYEEK